MKPRAVASARRVSTHTSRSVQRRIDAQTFQSVHRAAARPASVSRRLRQLDREWDIERTIEANAATLSLLGLAASLLTGRRIILALPVVVAAFLLQHALQGWCPPVPVLRRLGFRTVYEIERERAALRALRGDFRAVRTPRDAARLARH